MSDFDFATFMRKAELREIQEEWAAKHGCPESVYFHSDPDVDGKCLFCRRKVGSKMERPAHDLSLPYKTEATLAYEYHYSPDYGTNNLDKY